MDCRVFAFFELIFEKISSFSWATFDQVFFMKIEKIKERKMKV